MTRWGRNPTGNSAINKKLGIRSSGLCRTRNRIWRMRPIKFSWILRLKKTGHIISARRSDLVIVIKKIKENLLIRELSRLGRSQNTIKRKQKDR